MKLQGDGQSGVSVVEVFVNPAGGVDSADVLEAPDSHIERALLAAAREWEFEPLKSSSSPNQYHPVRGKLTFYFLILPDGSGNVLHPEETPDGVFAPTPVFN